MPLLSFVVPVYNRASLLPRALDSVLADSGADFEIVVVDDGSSDSSREVMAAYAALDTRVRVFKNPRNLGLGATRNHAFDQATGAWVVLLDSDNSLVAGAISRLRTTISAIGANVVACWFGSRDSTGQRITTHGVTRVIPGREFRDERFPGEHLGMVRADVARRVRYPSLGTKGECPPCFWYGIAELGDVYVTDEVVHVYDTEGTDRLCAPDNVVRRAGELATCCEHVAREFAASRPWLSAQMGAKAHFYRTVEGTPPNASPSAIVAQVIVGGPRHTLPYLLLAAGGTRLARWALMQRLRLA